MNTAHKDYPHNRLSEAEGAHIPQGLANSVSAACNEFFKSRNMAYGNAGMDEVRNNANKLRAARAAADRKLRARRSKLLTND